MARQLPPRQAGRAVERLICAIHTSRPCLVSSRKHDQRHRRAFPNPADARGVATAGSGSELERPNAEPSLAGVPEMEAGTGFGPGRPRPRGLSKESRLLPGLQGVRRAFSHWTFPFRFRALPWLRGKNTGGAALMWLGRANPKAGRVKTTTCKPP